MQEPVRSGVSEFLAVAFTGLGVGGGLWVGSGSEWNRLAGRMGRGWVARGMQTKPEKPVWQGLG